MSFNHALHFCGSLTGESWRMLQTKDGGGCGGGGGGGGGGGDGGGGGGGGGGDGGGDHDDDNDSEYSEYVDYLSISSSAEDVVNCDSSDEKENSACLSPSRNITTLLHVEHGSHHDILFSVFGVGLSNT